MNLVPKASRTDSGASEPIEGARAVAFFVSIYNLAEGASIEVTIEGRNGSGPWARIAKSPRMNVPTHRQPDSSRIGPSGTPWVAELGQGLGLEFANERIAGAGYGQLRAVYNLMGGAVEFAIDAKVIPQ